MAERYHVVRDDREKPGKGWIFDETNKCSGTTVERLETGDYTIRGYESEIIIERKGDICEFKANLFQEYDRFCRELDRMATFRYAYVMLEFELEDISKWPQSSGLPDRVIETIKVTNRQFLARFTAIRMRYPHVHFDFVGPRGKTMGDSLFWQLIRMHPEAAAESSRCKSMHEI